MELCKRLARRFGLLMLLAALLTVCALAADAQAATPDEFYNALEAQLRAQTANFSIAYTGDRADLDLPDDSPLAYALRNMSARSPDGPDNADYPALNVNNGQMGWLDGAYYFDLDYLATPEELAEVSRRAQEIVDSFDLDGEDDYTKIKLLYEYICTHYTYDDTLTKFSAYDGLTTGSMVCQGYALLTYRVMWSAGIPCRIITGTSQGQNHAWNIVELDGKWYNLDTTWDAAPEIGGVMEWTYFLKSPEDFTGHYRFDPYASDAYEQAHPMAETSVELPRITLEIDGDHVSSLIIRSGVEVQLTAVLPEGMDSEIQWSSSDPDVIAVTADGRITVQSLGEAVITASVTGNRGVISAQMPTQAVDLRAASPWAYESVTDYYLSQLLPYSLCSNFQGEITRAQLARLCYQFILQTRGWNTAMFNNPFEDVAITDPDGVAILRCNAIGLMVGTSETTFSPDAPVTREQAAVVLSRLCAYLDDQEPEAGEAAYADAADIHGWALDAVGAMTAAGVLQGDDSGRFAPRDPMTLEQMITALYRVYEPRISTLTPAEAA